VRGLGFLIRFAAYLVTTLVNVLAAQAGHLSLTAKVTVVGIMVFGGSMLALAVMYNQFLKNIMTEQDRDISQHGQL
jgi:uncharacterized membrane protein YgdD (TMEM256/DUF423 family)